MAGAIKFSPGCACCIPDCTEIYKELSEDGSTFNSTDWSYSGTVQSIDAVDVITVSSGTLTPLFSMDSNPAYYIQFKIRDGAGTTPQVEIEMGTESADVNFSAETIQMNAITARELPTYDLDEWVTVNVYFCPTHSMVQCEGQINGTAHPDQLSGASYPYEQTTVDTASPTVNQSWTIKITGDAQISDIRYKPADVVYTGAIRTTDCGRHDIFGNTWGFWKQQGSADVDITDVTQKINLTVTGSDVSLTQLGTTYDSRFWSEDNGGVFSGTTTGEPQDHYDVVVAGVATHSYYNAGIVMFALRSVKKNNGDGTWDWVVAIDGPGPPEFEGVVEIYRPEPTQATPYPEPVAVAWINGNSNSLGGADDSADAFIISDSGTYSVQWDHPYP